MTIQAVIDTSRTRYFTDVVSEFDGSGSTSTTPIISYQWDFGDGTVVTGTDNHGWHRYTTPNNAVVVTLTVTNDIGETSTATHTISVESPIIDTGRQLRRYIIQFMDLFNDLSVVNKDGTTIKVPLLWGNPDRVVAYLRKEIGAAELNRAISLPIASARLAGMTPAYDRAKFNNNSTYLVDPNLNNQVQKVWAPTPVDLEFELGLWCLDYGQAFSLLETIIPWFNDHLVIQTGTDDYTSPCIVRLVDVNDSNVVDIGTDQRLVRYDLNFITEGYLPPNRVVSDLVTSTYTTIV